ncbi:helix-turn-helix domain-containing protein [Aquabacterium sp. OR-4]|uniref:helix-turn-helix domain-containing protein n=1 Tax=Aquabacterium sp. OR-4 TaxID=2978127 RepID=UPI0021B39915|nr:helix-turn-helix transcriptional regulator [Aquabacterium sp. OR-4]MDT7838041.1 helix-turn-helix transcriptional regulator [Aquabacterium sp. OR-4]
MSQFSALPRLGLLGDSFLYAGHAGGPRVCRHSVTLVCALTAQPLQLLAAGQRFTGLLMAVRPFTLRHIDAPGQAVGLLDLEPSHGRFSTFTRALAQALGGPPVQVLDAERHQGLLSCVRGFASGALVGRQLQAAVQLQLHALADELPPVPPLAPRVLAMMSALRLEPALPLAALASSVGVSPAHASRSFVEALGITVRQFALALKIQRAAMHFGSDRSLTEVAQLSGFADSAHLSRVWVRCYGASPSRYLDALAQPGPGPGRLDHVWRQPVRLVSA